jgi:lantibiotic modifying enzyme
MSRLDLWDSALYKQESEMVINNAFSKMLETKLHHLDTLCCGNSGRIDFVLELKKRNILSTQTDKYIKLLKNSLVQKYYNEKLRYFSKFETTDINVGLYQGLSGIGYALLRTTDPNKYQSLLLFD